MTAKPLTTRAKIAVLGPGAIGSTFAYQLATAGHDVTVVARSARLAILERDGAVVLSSGARAAVTVAAALDVSVPYDLILVSVLASQVDAVLPALHESAARRVMYMFNTFDSLDPLRDAVGSARFAFGFPSIVASIDVEGRLTAEIVHHGLVTTVDDAGCADMFQAAGIPTVVERDMESWLRTHAAFIVPILAIAVTAYERGGGITWPEAERAADAMEEGFGLVESLGNALVPHAMVVVRWLPRDVRACLLWAASRVPSVQRTGGAGAGEPRALIDAMLRAAGEKRGRLGALAELKP